MQQAHKQFINYLIVIALNIFVSNIWAFELEGTTQWHQRIELTPLSSGLVEKVTVKVGEQVKQGDLLLQLEHQLESSQQQLAQQRLKQAELLHAEAQREHERVEDLYERTLISDHERAIGEATWTGANVDLQAAKAALTGAERALQQRQIRAPFNAIIIARNVEAGGLINHQLLQIPQLTIASSTTMLIEGYLQVSQLAQTEGKRALQVKVAGKKVDATIDSVAMESATDKQELYQIRLLIPYVKGLRAGMKALISIN